MQLAEVVMAAEAADGAAAWSADVATEVLSASAAKAMRSMVVVAVATVRWWVGWRTSRFLLRVAARTGAVASAAAAAEEAAKETATTPGLREATHDNGTRTKRGGRGNSPATGC